MINLTPLLKSCPPYTSKLGKYSMCLFSIRITGGLNPNSPAIITTRQALGHPTDSSVKGRWRGSLTRTTHHAMTHRWEPAQAGFVTIMGTASVYVYCMCVHVLVCLHVCEGVCEHVNICVVRLWCWLSAERGGRRRGALTSVWCMLLWRQQPSESSGLSKTDYPDRKGVYHDPCHCA